MSRKVNNDTVVSRMRSERERETWGKQASPDLEGNKLSFCIQNINVVFLSVRLPLSFVSLKIVFIKNVVFILVAMNCFAMKPVDFLL